MRRWLLTFFPLVLIISIILSLAGLQQRTAPKLALAQVLDKRQYLSLVGRFIPPVVLNEPTTLTPAFGPCENTYWESIPTILGTTAYLTLNVNSPASSFNSGKWQPILPEEGFYRVEAYIPAHDPFTFCKPAVEVQGDTAEARYFIHHAGGDTWKFASQRPLADQWLDLGVYLFKAGSDGFVELSDLNGEASLSATVSFSALRFTFLAAPRRYTLPLISNFPEIYHEVEIRTQPAFDNCNYPSVAAMQNWWTNSPYYIYNIYLGGASFAKGCSLPNADWISQVRQQGWAFIPTWVGPQASCSTWNVRMDPDPAIAYQQGRAEADLASAAVFDRGLVISSLGRSIIYYDLESYGNTSCRNVTNAFINGWVERLHELGHRAGVYGSGCTSYLTDFAFIPNVPDDIWAASYYTDTYDPNASVFGIRCLSDDLWKYHQRIYQYAGGHSETWGGKSITIDSDLADGEVSVPGLPQPAPLAAAPNLFAGTAVQDWGWLSPDVGWTLAGGRLLWTQDGGLSWQEKEGPDITAAAFLDASQGWAIAYPDASGDYPLYHTTDGGSSWQVSNLPLPEGDWQPLQVAFLDELNGWAVYRGVTSSAFSRGVLLKTGDGGRSWKAYDLPIGERVAFNTPLSGWTAGGAAGNELYHTGNGGLTWQPVEISPVGLEREARVNYSLPDFTNPQEGLLPVMVTPSGGEPRLELYASRDGGLGWELQAVLPATGDELEKVPVAVLNGLGWVTGVGDQVFAAPAGSPKYLPGGDASSASLAVSRLPDQITRLAFATAQDGWAVTVEGSCQGKKHSASFTCQQVSRQWRTIDGGHTWQELTLPASGK